MNCIHCGAKIYNRPLCTKHNLPFCQKCGKHLIKALEECVEK